MNPNNTLMWITAGTQLLGIVGPLAMDLAFKLKHTMELDPDVSVSITNLEAEAIDADDRTMEMIAQWREDNNIPDKGI